MKTYTINANQFDTELKGGSINVVMSEKALRDLIKANPELLQEEPEKKFKFFKPERGEHYHYLTSGNFNKYQEEGRYPEDIIRGVYATREEAELADHKRMAIVRLWNYADENMYFRPDWENTGEQKWYVYSYGDENFIPYQDENKCKTQFALPYFKSTEDAEQFIKDNQADLELLFLK